MIEFYGSLWYTDFCTDVNAVCFEIESEEVYTNVYTT